MSYDDLLSHARLLADDPLSSISARDREAIRAVLGRLDELEDEVADLIDEIEGLEDDDSGADVVWCAECGAEVRA